MDQIKKNLLMQVADLHTVPEGAYNIRENGAAAGRKTTANIDIVSKTDKPGIDIIVKPNTKNESIHIPVIIGQTGIKDLVYNDFYIEDFHALHGFISGMISRDYDITHIFIDSITKIAGESFDEFDGFLCKLENLSDKYNVNFTITVSAPVASATDEIKKYLTTL